MLVIRSLRFPSLAFPNVIAAKLNTVLARDFALSADFQEERIRELEAELFHCLEILNRISQKSIMDSALIDDFNQNTAKINLFYFRLIDILDNTDGIETKAK